LTVVARRKEVKNTFADAIKVSKKAIRSVNVPCGCSPGINVDEKSPETGEENVAMISSSEVVMV
jgi:hypothetical protein